MLYLLVYLFNLILLTVMYDFGFKSQLAFVVVGIWGVLFVLWIYYRKEDKK